MGEDVNKERCKCPEFGCPVESPINKSSDPDHRGGHRSSQSCLSLILQPRPHLLKLAEQSSLSA